MFKKNIPIKGMHCRSCEILIGEKLKRIEGVQNVHVSWKKKEAVIYAKHPVSNELIKQAVFDAGYEVGQDGSKTLFSRNIDDYYALLFSFVILYFIYSVAKALGFDGINVGGSNPSSLLVVLMVGLTAGISTCMALVGGLVLGISARHSEKHPEATTAQKFRPHLYFNAGRILSYFVLGGILGLVGKAFQLNGPTLGVLTIAVGLIMLTLGLQLTQIFPKLSNLSLTLPSSISSALGIRKHHEKEYSHFNSALVGALTFFLPCGFTQAMQLFAISTGNPFKGALIMGIFALGTAPGLLGIGGLTSILKGAFAKNFFRFTGALVLILAILNISNGYNLTGWKSPFARASSPKNSSSANVTIENGVQVVRMDQIARGYSPNVFTIQKDIPVKWIVNSKEPGSCAASIFMSKYKIRKLLEPGENIIEFTPTEIGDVRFSCSMGMYNGKFIVVEKQEKTSLLSTASAASPSVTATPSPQATATTPSKIEVSRTIEAEEETPVSSQDVQVISTTYKSIVDDIYPNQFDVKADRPVRFEISSNVDGEGCMATIMIPGLVNRPELLTKNEKIVFEFTPKKGVYDITCAMGVVRGLIYAS